ncbi:MAG TPA: insulinase family protein, partial [Thermodesulfovibrionia bacterium]|nr:insulinase family protein [Thermodesulfovibrionia bacterium]
MKKSFKLIVFSLLLPCLVFTYSAINAFASENTSLHEEVLPNGLKVLALKDPGAPLAVFQVWYHAGSINEQFGKTGLSHLLEHMMFKGTPKYG